MVNTDIIIGSVNVRTEWNCYVNMYWTLETPEVRTNFIEIPGGDGSLDLTTALSGWPNYNNRQLNFTLYSDLPYEAFKVLFSSIVNKFHGTVQDIVLPVNKGFHLNGRVFVSNGEWNGFGTVDFTVNCGPFFVKDTLTVNDYVVNPPILGLALPPAISVNPMLVTFTTDSNVLLTTQLWTRNVSPGTWTWGDFRYDSKGNPSGWPLQVGYNPAIQQLLPGNALSETDPNYWLIGPNGTALSNGYRQFLASTSAQDLAIKNQYLSDGSTMENMQVYTTTFSFRYSAPGNIIFNPFGQNNPPWNGIESVTINTAQGNVFQFVNTWMGETGSTGDYLLRPTVYSCDMMFEMAVFLSKGDIRTTPPPSMDALNLYANVSFSYQENML